MAFARMSGEAPAVREALPVYINEAPESEIVPLGYRQTEVGVIPEDWEVVPLSELLDFRNGANADKRAYGQGTPFINVLEVIMHTHFRASDVQGRVRLPTLLVDSYAVRRGDILFNRTSETQEEVGLASVYLGDEKVVFGGFVIRGRNRGPAIDDIYSGYAFRSPIIRSQIISKGQGAIRANIGQQELSKVVAVLPPLSEQRVIAATLSDVDALIFALDKLIAKKRAVKTTAMQHLLAGKQRLSEFSEEWGTIQLKCIVDQFIVPMRDKPKVFGGDIPWCRIEDFRGKYLYESKSGQQVSESIVGEMNLKVHPPDTLLVSCSADLGRCAIVKRPLVTNQTFIGLVCNKDKVSEEFLYYYMTYNSDTLNNLSSGTTISYLSREHFEALSVVIPTRIEEQTAIAAVLSGMDAEISALEARREKTRQVKQGMMQELLTGRTRLV